MSKNKKLGYFVYKGAAGFVGAIGGPMAPEGSQLFPRIDALIPDPDNRAGYVATSIVRGQNIEDFWETHTLKAAEYSAI